MSTVYIMTPFQRKLLIITVIGAAIMELIDISIVNVALNYMSGNLGSTLEDTAWVITSYAIGDVIIISAVLYYLFFVRSCAGIPILSGCWYSFGFCKGSAAGHCFLYPQLWYTNCSRKKNWVLPAHYLVSVYLSVQP